MHTVFLGDFPEPDCLPGAPHPRQTPHVFGHGAAEAAFLEAFNGGRMHHAWLVTGREGIGKATLAWRMARFLLATPPSDDGGLFGAPEPPRTLDIDPDHAVARRLAALSEPRAFLLRRGLNERESAPAQDILVKEVRLMKDFFGLSAADGGRRVAIVDCADELNTSAANALLKLLEEPPAGVTFFLISHQPHRLLPTIRSRTRVLRLSPLSPDDLGRALGQAGASVEPKDQVALAELAGGSVGNAWNLTDVGGLRIYAMLIALLDGLPGLHRPRALALAETTVGKAAEGRFDLIVTLLDLALARLARTGATGTPPPEAAPGESAMLRRLAPDARAARHWADLAQSLGLRARRGKAVNLDPAALLMDMFLRIDETAGSLATR